MVDLEDWGCFSAESPMGLGLKTTRPLFIGEFTFSWAGFETSLEGCPFTCCLVPWARSILNFHTPETLPSSLMPVKIPFKAVLERIFQRLFIALKPHNSNKWTFVYFFNEQHGFCSQCAPLCIISHSGIMSIPGQNTQGSYQENA